MTMGLKGNFRAAVPRALVAFLAVLVMALTQTSAQANQNSAADQSYREWFERVFPRQEAPLDAHSYATVERYDEEFLREAFCSDSDEISNEDGSLAWSLANYMISLNEMFEATGRRKYLLANLECARAVLLSRDDVRGDTLWNGKVAPVWGATKYSSDGRTAHLVHTAQIAAPVLKLLWLARGLEGADLLSAAESDSILASVRESLAFHDRLWRNGPGEGEGYYREDSPTAPRPQPPNCLAAMGVALWYSWKLSGDTVHREKTLSIARFIKNRLALDSGDWYWWPHDLPKGYSRDKGYPDGLPREDISHGGLVVSLPVLLASEGEVFDRADMERFGRTVVSGFARLGDGILFGRIGGTGRSSPIAVRNPALWLRLSPYAPDVYERISAFYTNYVKDFGPLDLALLIRYAPDR
jgi:hypothetical protein